MALQQFDLNRAGDTPIATLKLNEIAPVNWHKFPPAIAPSNPVYVPTVSFTGGATGDDVDEATAASTDNYTPKTQAQKASAMGVPLAEDITRARGWIAPSDPYAAKPAAPTLASITPNSAAAGGSAVTVQLTGTGFSPWSTVTTGGVPTPYFRYVSPTRIDLVMDTKRSVAGTINVTVTDHDVTTAAVPFTFT